MFIKHACDLSRFYYSEELHNTLQSPKTGSVMQKYGLSPNSKQKPDID